MCFKAYRRFGKTVTANMIYAYYSYSIEKTNVFNNKKLKNIVQWDKYLNKFNVIKLNMINYFYNCSVEEDANEIKVHIINEVEETIPNFKFSGKNNIIRIFEDIYKKLNVKLFLL